MAEFNEYLEDQLQGGFLCTFRWIFITTIHYQNKLVQAVDLFAWGIFRKYERQDTAWYEVFKEKIVSEVVYP